MVLATLPTPAQRLQDHRDEYQTHLAQTEHVQALLLEDVAELAAQEGWDVGVQRGLEEWAGDTGMVWRALRVGFSMF